MTDFNKMANDGYDPALLPRGRHHARLRRGPLLRHRDDPGLPEHPGRRPPQRPRRESWAPTASPFRNLYSAGEFGGMTPVPVQRRRQHGRVPHLRPAWPAWARRPSQGSAAGAAHGRGQSEIVYTSGQRQPRGRSRPGRFTQSSARTSISAPPPCAWATRLALKVTMEGSQASPPSTWCSSRRPPAWAAWPSRPCRAPDHRGPVHRGRRRCRRYRFLHGPEGRREQRTRPGEVARLMRRGTIKRPAPPPTKIEAQSGPRFRFPAPNRRLFHQNR